jgi:hypothetical protein
VIVATNAEKPHWSRKQAALLKEYEIPVHLEKITGVDHRKNQVRGLRLKDGKDGKEVKIDTSSPRGGMFFTPGWQSR